MFEYNNYKDPFWGSWLRVTDPKHLEEGDYTRFGSYPLRFTRFSRLATQQPREQEMKEVFIHIDPKDADRFACITGFSHARYYLRLQAVPKEIGAYDLYNTVYRVIADVVTQIETKETYSIGQ